MKKYPWMLGGAIIAGMFSGAYADDLTLPAGVKEGQWAITTTIKVDNAPANIPPKVITSTMCINKKNPIPQNNTAPNCPPPKYSVNGNTIAVKYTCDVQPSLTMTLEGQTTYSGDTMEGHSVNTIVSNGMTMTSNIATAGHYVGPCPQGANP